MTRRARAWLQGLTVWLTMGLALGLASGLAGRPAQAQTLPAAAAEPDRHLIVAVIDRPAPLPSAGSPPRMVYRRPPSYAGSDRALGEAEALAQAHGLVEVAAWSIPALAWRCMLYRVPEGSDRGALLEALQRDARVALVQPLNEFETAGQTPAAETYDDPYLPLQSALQQLQALPAHRLSQGETVRIAVIDSAVDSQHPDLAGRVVAQRDFVGPGRNVPGLVEAHGTQVAGVMVANAHNAQGIVGVAPRAQLLAYRACWAAAEGSRCNSFTLAQALAAALEAGAELINLSLAGPRDPLLEALAAQALHRGAWIVGAVPPGGRLDGFPLALPGVFAVASSNNGQAVPATALAAPGERVLTLMPGACYDFASGSSMATAHVSGVLALMCALRPRLEPERARALLQGGVNACRALQALAPDRGLPCAPLAP
jgi:subtilisin family serine protease